MGALDITRKLDFPEAGILYVYKSVINTNLQTGRKFAYRK